MTRISKKSRLKNCPRKHKAAATKTGSKKDNLSLGYREHGNAVEGDAALGIFVGKAR